MMALIGISIGVTFLASLVIGPALCPAWSGRTIELTAVLALVGAGLSCLPRKTPVRTMGALFDVALVKDMEYGRRAQQWRSVGFLHALLMAMFLAPLALGQQRLTG